jgi:hypothetical protein
MVRLKERVEALQRLAESATRALGVLVDGDVDALADPERRRVAVRGPSPALRSLSCLF